MELIVIPDYFRKWVEVYRIANQKAVTEQEFWLINRFGLFVEINWDH